MREQQHQLDRITRLEIAVFGWRGDNGLLGTTQTNTQRLVVLEALVTQARTIRRVGRWFFLTMGGGLALVGADKAGAGMAWVIRTMAGGP